MGQMPLTWTQGEYLHLPAFRQMTIICSSPAMMSVETNQLKDTVGQECSEAAEQFNILGKQYPEVRSGELDTNDAAKLTIEVDSGTTDNLTRMLGQFSKHNQACNKQHISTARKSGIQAEFFIIAIQTDTTKDNNTRRNLRC
jgi:hypothetical protein